VGHCGNHRSSDEVLPYRRHRRSRPISRAGSSRGELQRMGARLWTCRFPESSIRSWQGSKPESRRCSQCEGGGGILSFQLLVFLLQVPAKPNSREPVPTAMASLRA
jgi:hypothetical protein